MRTLDEEEVKRIEKEVDEYLISLLNSNLPRNSFIYHLNLVYIDLVVDQSQQFETEEKHFLFSLSYLTYLAHCKLVEEERTDFSFIDGVYKHAFYLFLLGIKYAVLCENFPFVNSNIGKLNFDSKTNKYIFEIGYIPKKNLKYFSDYTIRKSLDFTLQCAIKKYVKLKFDDETIALNLADTYLHFWNENMNSSDIEPYSQMIWGGFNFFLIVASMRRYSILFRNSFDIVKVGSHKAMICLSPKGVSNIMSFIPNCNEKDFKQVFGEHIYKPIGRELYPKICISDTPVNYTKDGHAFINPLVMLYSNSYETRYLNFLRKSDQARYMKVKDEIKERVIPVLIEMIKFKIPNSIVISNFHVPIPGTKKMKRECDLLIIDNEGHALYIEVKHFYYPSSFSELKTLDSELAKSLKKMPLQIDAISNGWDYLKKVYMFDRELKEINGVITSHLFTGYNIEISSTFPIVSNTSLYESIAQAVNVPSLYLNCLDFDVVYSSLMMNTHSMMIDFAGLQFETKGEKIDPKFESLFIQAYRKQVTDVFNRKDEKSFNNSRDLAKAYMMLLE